MVHVFNPASEALPFSFDSVPDTVPSGVSEYAESLAEHIVQRLGAQGVRIISGPDDSVGKDAAEKAHDEFLVANHMPAVLAHAERAVKAKALGISLIEPERVTKARAVLSARGLV